METERKVVTVCYGRREVWASRSEAFKSFFEAFLGTEGAERDRYANVLADLSMGRYECSDHCEW